MTGKRYLGATMALVLAVGACSDPEANPLTGDRVTLAAPRQLLSAPTEVFTAGRLASVITQATPGPANQAKPSLPSDDSAGAVAALDQSIGDFTHAAYQSGASQNQMRDARNQIQGALIVASINRCNVYKTHLRRMASNTNFSLGTTALALAGASTIASGPATRVLSGLSTIFAGANAEFEKDFMGNLLTSVIIPGIDKQRSLLLNDIAAKRCRTVTDYPLTLAMAEALRFHGACSADVGIAASGQAIAQTHTASLQQVQQAVEQIKKLQATMTKPAGQEGTTGARAADAPVSPTQNLLVGDTLELGNDCEDINNNAATRRRSPRSQGQVLIR